ncbi:hypothetical protein PMAYCL1PPCAC_08553, partial [Pristionchus mayeri]
FQTLPSFPIGAHMDITAVMRASGAMNQSTPSLWFRDKNHSYEWFMSIQQTFHEGTEELKKSKFQTKCSSDVRPHGDLQHFRIRRIDKQKLSVRI